MNGAVLFQDGPLLYQVRLQEQLPEHPQPLRHVLPTLLGVTVASLHREAGGNSGSEKNSSHTDSANSSAGGMVQKP